LKKIGKQERSRQTISIILSAAAQVLIDQGFEKATTNRIANHAGYSVGTVYQYFDDKEDIYGEIVDQVLLKLTESAANCMIQPSLRETLGSLQLQVLASLGQDPALIQALEALLAGLFRDKRKAAYDELVASVVRILEAHRSEIVVKDLKIAAEVIVGASAGLATSESAPVLESPDLIEQLVRLQFAYLTLPA
jgi:AcrR family transcriptional regulator